MNLGKSFTPQSLFFFSQALLPALRMAALNEKVVEKKRVALHDIINTMEKFYLVEGHQYMGGAGHMSIADVWAACEMGQALSVGFDLRSTHPKVAG